jgi:hypothetical protein
MFRQTAFAAITAAAATLPGTANAGSPHIHFGIQIPGGYFSFGNGPVYPYPAPQPQAMTCWQAKNYLEYQFAKVWTVECSGQTYTFNVKNGGPIHTVKFDKWSGDYWFV